ncbi:DUF2637 domain-containing protein [Streptomyces sp. NPDC087272]|uniref:DUF2637 domain-containing protein n=1 Tax=Streptomyces sp. NPDC087272 TaxID=3365775 RepID=UPI003800C93E
MNDALTDDQTPATRGAMAPATPETAEAAPDANPATPATPATTPPAPRKGGLGVADLATPDPATAPAADDAAPAIPATPTGQGSGARWVNGLLLALALVGMPLVGVIGFASSYATLRAVAGRVGFADDGFWSLAPWVPIGIDVSIVALLAMDLVMVRRRTPWPVLRLAAHGMTLVTVVLNAVGSAWDKEDEGLWGALAGDPGRALLHAALPLLFVLGVGAARRVLKQAAQIEEEQVDRIPVHRWILSPTATPRLYRRMRLAGVRSYPAMVEREQALAGYKVWLGQKYRGDLSKASEVERLPMTMAPRGYTVEEALALPAKWEAEEEERKEAEAERARQKAERQREQAKRDRIVSFEDKAEVAEAEHRAAARTDTAAAQATAVKAEAEAKAEAARTRAELSRTAAERKARAETEALESEEAADARLRAAEAAERAAEKEGRAAALRKEAAQQAEQAERIEQETDRAAARRLAERRRLAQEETEVADAEHRAARIREEVACMEAAAQVAEDYARLSQRERNERRVARMILSSGGDKESVSLRDIMEELGLKQTAAGEVRTAAAELLAAGYQPTKFDSMS